MTLIFILLLLFFPKNKQTKRNIHIAHNKKLENVVLIFFSQKCSKVFFHRLYLDLSKWE